MNLIELVEKSPKLAIFVYAIHAIKRLEMKLSTVVILIGTIFGLPLYMLADFAKLMLG